MTDIHGMRYVSCDHVSAGLSKIEHCYKRGLAQPDHTFLQIGTLFVM